MKQLNFRKISLLLFLVAVLLGETLTIQAATDKTAPKITKIEAITAAVLNLIILVPTDIPKTFEASLAPKDHPKNKPLVKKNKYVKSIRYPF